MKTFAKFPPAILGAAWRICVQYLPSLQKFFLRICYLVSICPKSDPVARKTSLDGSFIGKLGAPRVILNCEVLISFLVAMLRPNRSARCLQAILLICIVVPASGCRDKGGISSAGMKDTAAARSYSTTFSRTENPISEDGKWIAGHDAGASLWGNVQTVSGAAYGVDEPTPFGDPTAALAGTWGPTQTATATVNINKTPTNQCCHEVELRLRTTVSRQSITGYEAYCSVMPKAAYCHIARWNGPNGSYWNFETGSSTAYVKDGDVMKATATGTNPTIITLWVNGAQILQATDTGAAGGGFGAYGPWTSGSPGIGFFDNYDSDWKSFGLSSFSATDGQQ